MRRQEKYFKNSNVEYPLGSMSTVITFFVWAIKNSSSNICKRLNTYGPKIV